jgi:predicted RNase H-like nuclease (RuvC/YqgF family)
MTKFEELLNVFMDVISEVSESRKSSDNEDKKENETYFRSVYDEYENGKHVTHSDKEYKNGKCVKNEGFDERKEFSDKSNDTCKCGCDKNETDYKKRIEELEASVKKLSETNKQLQDSVMQYKNKLEAITSIVK